MKKNILLLFATFALVSCGKSITVQVTNNQNMVRENETVVVAWADATAKLGEDLNPDDVVVIDNKGVQIPSQVIYEGQDAPQGVIFQATVGVKSSATYKVKRGSREAYEVEAYGRFVPERMDDFAWENNIMAFRMYGPALEATGEISNGIDVWLKRTGEMIINKWYTPGYDYHRDQGEGLDCYKVGRTLGAGAMAPYVDRKLWLGKNYTEYKILDNGPVRISFELSYAPYMVDSTEVTEKRIITLDANTHFNKITEIYTGDFTEMPVAAGVVLRGGEKNISTGKILDIKPVTMVGYWEPVNMDGGVDNGVTGLGLVFDSEIKVETRLGHLLAGTTAKAGEPMTYLSGAAWSKADMPTSQEWTNAIIIASKKFNNPLRVTVK